MRSVDDLLTPDELADELFGNMDLTSNEKQINKDWLNEVFRFLRNGEFGCGLLLGAHSVRCPEFTLLRLLSMRRKRNDT